MKKIVFMLALLIGIASFAQRGEGPKHKGEALKDMTPEQIATLKTKRMALALDLSDDQQEEMMAVVIDQVNFRKEKMEERKALKEKDEKPSADELFEIENARLDHQMTVQEKMKDILNEEQFEKWQKMAKHQYKKGKGKRKGKMQREGRR